VIVNGYSAARTNFVADGTLRDVAFDLKLIAAVGSPYAFYLVTYESHWVLVG